jgi:hypothetical protein
MHKLIVIATALVALLIPAIASARGAWHNQIRNRPTVLAASGDGRGGLGGDVRPPDPSASDVAADWWLLHCGRFG